MLMNEKNQNSPDKNKMKRFYYFIIFIILLFQALEKKYIVCV